MKAKLIPSPEHMRFRPITPADLPLINRLMRAGKGYWGYGEEGLDRFMQTFGIANETYFDTAFGFIAESAQGVMGYYLFKMNESALELDHFFLETTLIGQGYGRLQVSVFAIENKGVSFLYSRLMKVKSLFYTLCGRILKYITRDFVGSCNDET